MHILCIMRTTLEIDDQLLADAQRVTRAPTKRALVEAGLQALLREEARRRAIALGGSMPDIDTPPRRRGPSQSR
jgi:Arc/MetJ family transcription regulator